MSVRSRLAPRHQVKRAAIRAVVLGLAVLATSPLGGSGEAAAQPLRLGFFDVSFTGASGPSWLGRSAGAGASMVRIDIGWPVPDTAEPPTNFDPRNPADPHYDFSADDAAIRQASADGLRVLVEFSGAPRWAEGVNPPAGVSPGSWRPNPAAVHDYGIALARRYTGHFPDPQRPGRTLPAVAGFQFWNEPNLDTYLSPQYVGTRSVAPGLYRSMLNAFDSGVKSIDPHALVVSAGTAPFGDPPGGARTPPVDFWRGVLCLTGAGTRAAPCGPPLHVDVIAHHPYSVGAPSNAALNPGDISIPDLWKLRRIVRAAEKLGRLLPRRPHPLWVTETSYDSDPPDPNGVPVLEQAHWLEQALAELWRGGVSAVFWNQVGDEPPIPSYAASAQSGVYFIDGSPKPALTAYRFPLVSRPAGRGRIEIWGRSPAAGVVAVQRAGRSGWETVRRLRVGRGQVFDLSTEGNGRTRLRAVEGAQTSLVWP